MTDADSLSLLSSMPYLPHPFECLPGRDRCTICGLLSVDGENGDLHGFFNDCGEVARSKKDVSQIKDFYKYQKGVDYDADDWKLAHFAALGDNRFAAQHRAHATGTKPT
jgi:hypothetical protein